MPPYEQHHRPRRTRRHRHRSRIGIGRATAPRFAHLGAKVLVADVNATADVSDAEWERLIRINLTAPFLLTRAVLPHLPADGKGAIVNTTSEAALRGARLRPALVSPVTSDATADRSAAEGQLIVSLPRPDTAVLFRLGAEPPARDRDV